MPYCVTLLGCKGGQNSFSVAAIDFQCIALFVADIPLVTVNMTGTPLLNQTLSARSIRNVDWPCSESVIANEPARY